MRYTDGTWRYVEAVVTDMRNRSSVGGYVINVRDITERKEAEDKLAHQALHDPLTGLPNRLLLVDRLRTPSPGARRDRPPAGGDVPRPRPVQARERQPGTRGRATCCSSDVADRLRHSRRTTDTVSRFGGDEFVILCEDMADQDAVTALAERIMASFDEPFVIDGEKFHIGVSIGVAFVDDDVPSPEELLGDADYAMYLAKARSGQGRVQLFDQATRAVARQRVHTETALARALERERARRLLPADRGDGHRALGGVEALLRWQHPTRGLLCPAEFLDVAEQTGLIVPIGAWVLSEACQQVQRLERSASRPTNAWP